MKNNIGKADRTIRMILALVIAAAGFYYQSWWGFFAIIPLATAYFGSCPLYSMLGINTCGKKVDVN